MFTVCGGRSKRVSAATGHTDSIAGPRRTGERQFFAFEGSATRNGLMLPRPAFLRIANFLPQILTNGLLDGVERRLEAETAGNEKLKRFPDRTKRIV